MKETLANPHSIVDEIRSRDEMMDIHERNAQQLIQLVKKEIHDKCPRITVQRFREQYLPPILSEDRDTTEYGMKVLANDVGGIQQEFHIYDERSNELIFVFPSVSLPFRSLAIDYGGVSTYGKILGFRNSQNSSLPGPNQAFGQSIANEMRKVMDFDNAKDKFHQGWLELTDFCGVLTQQEEVYYAPIRIKKHTENRYSYWVNPLSMEDYIKKWGRVDGEYQRPEPDKLATLKNVIEVQEDIAELSHFPGRVPEEIKAKALASEQARQAYLSSGQNLMNPKNPIDKKPKPEPTDDWE